MQTIPRIFIFPEHFPDFEEVKKRYLYPLNLAFTTEPERIGECTAVLLPVEIEEVTKLGAKTVSVIYVRDLIAALKVNPYIR